MDSSPRSSFVSHTPHVLPARIRSSTEGAERKLSSVALLAVLLCTKVSSSSHNLCCGRQEVSNVSAEMWGRRASALSPQMKVRRLNSDSAASSRLNMQQQQQQPRAHQRRRKHSEIESHPQLKALYSCLPSYQVYTNNSVSINNQQGAIERKVY